LDASGFYPHKSEWAQNIDRSDAVLILIDAGAVDDGFFFTEEFFEQIAPLICSRVVPTYVLANRARECSSLQNLDIWFKNLFPSVPYSYSGIPEFNDDVYRAFEWINRTVADRKTKK
jgi:hypothetical protein